MSRVTYASLALASAGLSLAGCATAPVQTASGYASQGAHAIYTTGGDVYSGVGTAAKQPFHDLNMMQDPIPMVLLRAEAKPYDTTGLDSCQAILGKVAELDLALGPDLDAPKEQGKTRSARVATLAAAAALDAASSAAEGFLPMRSVIKHVSGASRYEEHVKHAVLSGTVRRGFLKAVGMQHNCGWPAAPLGFQPEVVAIATTPLNLPAAQPSTQYASAGQPGAGYAARAGSTGRIYSATLTTGSSTPAPPPAAAPALAPVVQATPVADTGPAGGWSPPEAVSDPADAPAPAQGAPAATSTTAALSPSTAFAAPWTKAAATGR